MQCSGVTPAILQFILEAGAGVDVYLFIIALLPSLFIASRDSTSACVQQCCVFSCRAVPCWRPSLRSCCCQWPSSGSGVWHSCTPSWRFLAARTACLTQQSGLAHEPASIVQRQALEDLEGSLTEASAQAWTAVLMQVPGHCIQGLIGCAHASHRGHLTEQVLRLFVLRKVTVNALRQSIEAQQQALVATAPALALGATTTSISTQLAAITAQPLPDDRLSALMASLTVHGIHSPEVRAGT